MGAQRFAAWVASVQKAEAVVMKQHRLVRQERPAAARLMSGGYGPAAGRAGVRHPSGDPRLAAALHGGDCMHPRPQLPSGDRRPPRAHGGPLPLPVPAPRSRDVRGLPWYPQQRTAAADSRHRRLRAAVLSRNNLADIDRLDLGAQAASLTKQANDVVRVFRALLASPTCVGNSDDLAPHHHGRGHVHK